MEHLPVRAELPALRLMRDRTYPPRFMDVTVLESGTKLGFFWSDCKSERRCGRPPYNGLLNNLVLRADYGITTDSGMRKR